MFVGLEAQGRGLVLTIGGSLGGDVAVRDRSPIWGDLVDDEAVGLGAEDLKSLLGDLGDWHVLPSLAATHDD